MTIEALYQIFQQYPSIQTDSRKLKAGDLFFALKGPSFNGNQFAVKALEMGAAYAVIDEPQEGDSGRLILVDVVLQTLQELARYHRLQFTIPFIAITGSNGKTTTKELVSTVLSSQFTTYTTQGNLNNHIGIPLTILSVKNDAAFAVIEMGANHQKEIEGYCKYTLPTHGIITNCGKAHLEGFGGVAGVRKGKGELFDYLKANKGVVFAYDEYDYLHEMTEGIGQVYWYGIHNGSVCGRIWNHDTFIQVAFTKGIEITSVQTQLVGEYNLPNILCAAAVGMYFSVPATKIKSALENYAPSNSRSQMVVKGSNHFILDAYNANPSSTKLAIENFVKLPANQKILMLGGMMELGAESLEEHALIIELINKYRWTKVVLVGGDYKDIPHHYIYFNTSAEAAVWLKEQRFENSYFLVKGSRSMQMEKVME